MQSSEDKPDEIVVNELNKEELRHEIDLILQAPEMREYRKDISTRIADMKQCHDPNLGQAPLSAIFEEMMAADKKHVSKWNMIYDHINEYPKF